MRKPLFKLKYKILLLIVILLLFLLTIITPLFISKERDLLLSDLVKRGESLVKNFALSCENLLITSGELGLEDVVAVLVKEPEVMNVYIVLDDMTYYLHNKSELLGKKYFSPKMINVNLKHSYNIIEKNNKLLYQFYYPVYRTTMKGYKERFGTAYVDITPKYVFKHIKRLKIEAILTITGIFVIGLLGTLFLSSLMVKPIKRLIKSSEIIGSGNLRHRIKVHTGDELEQLANEFNKMGAKLYSAQKKLIKQKLVEQELEIAHSIQKSIIPKEIPAIPEYEILTYYKTVRKIGGDYYTFIDKVKDKKLGVVIADVSGKGIPAALIMSMLHISLDVYIDEDLDAKKLMGKCSFALSKNLKKGNFITSIIGSLNQSTNTLEFVSAGHESPVYFKADGNKVGMIKSSGVPIGLMDNKIFSKELSVNKFKFGVGDILFFYTDGVRNLNPKNPFNNEEVLNFFKDLLVEYKDKFNLLKSQMKNVIFSHTKKLTDDITLIGIKRIK